MTNEQAVRLGKLRAAQMTKEERANYGRSGGNARAAKLPAKRRREIARNAARARWGKR